AAATISSSGSPRIELFALSMAPLLSAVRIRLPCRLSMDSGGVTVRLLNIMSFWKSLPKPFFALAPMADVTDPAYRRLIAEYKAPDVTGTEFVSADGLYHTREKAKMLAEENPLVRDLLYTEAERPIVAQLFSSKPEMMAYAANLCKE